MHLFWTRSSALLRESRAPLLAFVAVGNVASVLTLLAFRSLLGGVPYFGHIVLFNLLLAAMPLFFAVGAYVLHVRRAPGAIVLFSLMLWLLFLPNAPYVWTDVSHIFTKHGYMIFRRLSWCDLMIACGFAWTSMFLGFLSMLICHQIVRDRVSLRAAWVVTISSIVAQSFGVALGRLYRLNSWDTFTHPAQLYGWLKDIALFRDHHFHYLVLSGLVFYSGVYASLAALMNSRPGIHRA